MAHYAARVRAPFQVLVIPYRRTRGRFEACVLHRSDCDVWQFVSGGGEDDETPLEAARRESSEEAGISSELAPLALDSRATVPASWFAAWQSWPRELFVVPEYAYAIDVGGHELVISDEHRELCWLSFDGAMQQVRFDSNRTALWELHERLYPSVRTPRPAFDLRHEGSCPCSSENRER
jgi:dihydroneopterin triphosphate diphosphatase